MGKYPIAYNPYLELCNEDCWFTLLVLLFVLELIKKKKKINKKIFQSFFLILFRHFQSFFQILFRPPNLKSEKKIS